MLSYFAYGLGIHSDFPLPEFVAAEMPCDVRIRLDPVEASEDVLNIDSYMELGPGEALLAFRHVGAFRIRRGEEIVVSLARGADLALARLYLVGKAMGTLLYQRRFLVLHASAVDVDGLAVAFVGVSGAGKSSIAASLHSCGYRLVADDVSAVDLRPATPLLIPGFPQVKVHASVAHSLGHPDESLLLLHSVEGKRGLRLATGFSHTPLPLGLVYFLAPAGSNLPPLGLQDVMIELVRHSFPTRLLKSGGPAHLQQCARLAELVPARRFVRSDARPSPRELAARVLDDLDAIRRTASRNRLESALSTT
jgi:hypothetical protein